jgi:hypothetical protein
MKYLIIDRVVFFLELIDVIAVSLLTYLAASLLTYLAARLFDSHQVDHHIGTLVSRE